MGTMQTETKTFIEILEDEIRADLRGELRKEIEAEVAARYAQAAPSAAVHAAGRLETWLASHVGPITFKTQNNARKQAYGAAKARPATASRSEAAAPGALTLTAADLKFTASTPAELFALELLNRQSPARLATSFTEDELKSVWRKAALKTHPDRFAGADQVTQLRMTALFRELAEAYEVLLTLVETTQAKAA